MCRSLFLLGCVVSSLLLSPLTVLAEELGGKASKASPASVAVPDKNSKLIDINSASLKDLKTLTGIGDAEAKRIIAGRPYGSKAWLVSDGILDDAVYQGIRTSIVAKQPFKEAEKNLELYKNRHSK